MASGDGADDDVGDGEPHDPPEGNGGDGGSGGGAGDDGEWEVVDDEEGRFAGLVERAVRWLVGLLFGWIGGILGGMIGEEIDAVQERYDRGAREVEETVDSAKRGVKRVSMLLVALLLFALVAVLVWTAVGVAWLVLNAPVPVDLFWFGAGAIAGYLLCLATGIVFMRGR